ncbi:cyclin-dependent kinase 2-associated protein 2 [Armigeres subalbatus]|uniref:cyclin-dependent kinase 2-associated protein 2 n=1 Tax=Armigeres subalbatus TaxID=124917 RepID=UPI002ED2595A
MDYVDIQAVESKLTDVTVTPIPMGTKLSSTGHGTAMNTSFTNHHHYHQQQQFQAQNLTTTAALPSVTLTTAVAAASPTIPNQSAAAIVTPVNSLNHFPNNSNLSKYAQLLMVIEEMGRDIRPSYSGSRSSAERLKRGIVHARILVRECLLETERSARQ